MPDTLLAGGLPFDSLDEGLSALVQCLTAAIPLRAWMVSRVNGDEFTVLHACDSQHAITPGAVLSWTGSCCARMVRGEGPQFAHDAQAVPAYREAENSRLMKIGTYVGQPLLAADGSLLGSLCGVDPAVHREFTPEQRCLVKTLARTMSTLITTHLKIQQARQTEAQLRYRAETDVLTGLSNRVAWEEAIQAEEGALRMLGENAMVMIVDLDGLKIANDTKGHEEGDKFLRRAAAVLKEQLREADVLARIGGDEFAVLMHNVSRDAAEGIVSRLASAFLAADVHASIGYAMRLTYGSLRDAARVADVRMYEDKTRRKRDHLDLRVKATWACR